jgi:hypothetical protein
VEPSDKMGLPRDLRGHQKMWKMGEMTFQRDDKTLLLWMDKKPVNMISIMHSANITEVADKFGRRKMKLECVADYNPNQFFLKIYT